MNIQVTESFRLEPERCLRELTAFRVHPVELIEEEPDNHRKQNINH
jgi:hypothetical protein